MTPTGTMGVPVSMADGEAHEPQAELGQLVTLVESLRDAPGPLGEHEQGLSLVEEALGVLLHTDHLADAREEQGHEGQADRPFLDHRADDARRLGVHEHRGADEGAVDRHLPRVIRDEQDAPLRDVFDAVDLGAEVPAVQEPDGREGVLGPLGIEPERVDARRAQRHGHPLQALVEPLAEESIEHVVHRLLGRAQDATKELSCARAADGGVEARERS
jgi:hypothetical protein